MVRLWRAAIFQSLAMNVCVGKAYLKEIQPENIALQH
jgi:hypothetical protein